MVAGINSSKSFTKTFHYNEQKLKTGKAKILLASDFCMFQFNYIPEFS